MILRELFLVTGELPRIDIYEGIDREGRENVKIELFYRLEDYTIEAILYKLEAFNRIDFRKNRIDKCFIKDHYEELYNILTKKSNEARGKFQRIVESELQKQIYCANISVFKPVISAIFSQQDFVYSDYRQKIYIGFTQEGLDHYINRYQLTLQEFSDYYDGVHYNIMTVSGTTYVWDKKLWSEAWNWLYTLELDYGYVPVYQGCAKGRIMLSVVDFRVCIMSEAETEKADDRKAMSAGDAEKISGTCRRKKFCVRI